jgi:hypothetical protein
MSHAPAPVPHIIVGTRHQLLTVLRTAHSQGRLVAMDSQLRPVPGDPHGRVYLHARLRPPMPGRRHTAHQTRRRYLIAAAVAGALAVLALLIWAVAAAITAAISAIGDALPQLLGLAAVVGVLLLAAGRAGICPGIHCPGCRHR